MLNLIFGIEKSWLYVFLIDLIVLFFSLYLSINSKFYWPIWFSGFHTISVASGFSRILFPSDIMLMYTNFAEIWAIPALGSAAIGCILDHRNQIRLDAS